MSTIKWKKKNGNAIETNDDKETIKYMVSLGATKAGEKSVKKETGKK